MKFFHQEADAEMIMAKLHETSTLSKTTRPDRIYPARASTLP
jgi:hypothetical protein